MTESSQNTTSGRSERTKKSRVPIIIGSVIGAAAVVTVAALVIGNLQGSSSAVSPTTSTAASAAEAAFGGTLKVAFGNDNENYDPHQPPQLVGRSIARNITDQLTDQDPATGEILPWLATSWDVSDDVREFTFELREDVTFADGTAFNAESVKKNFDRIIDLGALARLGASFLRGYVETQVVDEFTAKVVFEDPNAQFLQATATSTLGFLSDATLALTPEEVAAGGAVGTGPYTIESYAPKDKLVLQVREDYNWGSPLYEHEGRAYADTIEVSFLPDATTQTGSVVSGQVDFAYLLDASTISSVQSSSATLIETPLPAITIPLVPLLHTEGPLQDERVRRALSLATDREELVTNVFQGLYEPASAVLTRKNPGWVDLSDKLQYDPDAAIALIEEAGWTTVGDDGIRSNAAGERLELLIQYSTAGTTAEAQLQLIQHQWKQVGIDFQLEPVTAAALSEYNIHNYPFDITTWSQTRADHDILRVVYSSFYENQSFLRDKPDAEVDELLVKLQSTVDTDERLDVSRQVQELLLDRGYTVPLYDLVNYSATAPGVEGGKSDIEGKPIFFDLHK